MALVRAAFENPFTFIYIAVHKMTNVGSQLQVGEGLDQAERRALHGARRGDLVKRLMRIYLIGPRRTRASLASAKLMPIDGRFMHAFRGCEVSGSQGERLWCDLSHAWATGSRQIKVSKAVLQFMLAWLTQSMKSCVAFIEEEGCAQEIEAARLSGAHKAPADSAIWSQSLAVEYLVLLDLIDEVRLARATLPKENVKQPAAHTVAPLRRDRGFLPPDSAFGAI